MRFRNIRIQTKLLYSYLVVILITVSLVGYFSYRTSMKEVVKNTEGFSQMLVEQLAVNVPNRIKNFEQSTYAIQNSSDFLDLMSEELTDETVQQSYISQLKLQPFLTSFYGLSRDIRAIIVQTNSGYLYWSEKSEYSGLSGSIDKRKATEFMDWAKRQLQLHNNIRSIWTPTDTEGEIAFTRLIINPGTLEVLGQIVFFLDSDYLNVAAETANHASGSVVVLNRYDDILSADPSVSPIIHAWLDRGERSTGKQTLFAHERERYLIFQEYAVNRQWGLLLVVPLNELLQASRKLSLYILITSAASLVVTAMIALGISKHVTGNIRKLERMMRKVEEGDFSAQVQVSSRDEIGWLSVRFNAMVSRINELIQHLYVERMAKQEAEFQVLKAQIQPHFLYNTMGSILWLARMHKQDAIAGMLKNLIDLLKTSVSKKSEYIAVHEEFSYIDNYLSIQKFRYENRFQASYELEDRVRDCLMLNFILQPLVENALLHGIEMSKGNGRIIIRAFAAKNHLQLEVEDNGVGMSEERIRQLLNEDANRKNYPSLHSIGVYNVNARIKLYCGQDYGLSYQSEIGRGTKAIIKLPLKRLEEENHA